MNMPEEKQEQNQLTPPPEIINALEKPTNLQDPFASAIEQSIQTVEAIMIWFKMYLTGKIFLRPEDAIKLGKLALEAASTLLERKYPTLSAAQVVTMNAAEIADRAATMMSPKQVQEKLRELRKAMLGGGAATEEECRAKRGHPLLPTTNPRRRKNAIPPVTINEQKIGIPQPSPNEEIVTQQLNDYDE